MWAIWSPTTDLSFKLQGASSIVGEQRQLAPTKINVSFTSSKVTDTPILKVPGLIGTAPVKFLVDSGAAISVARYDVIPDSLRTLISKLSDIVAVSASGHSLDIIGKADLPLTVGHIKLKHEFIIVPTLNVDCLLGVDFLTKNRATINCVKGCLTLASREVPFISTGSEDHNKQYHSSKTANPISSVMVLDTVEVQGRSVQFVTACLHAALDSPLHVPTTGLIEPIQSSSTPKHIMTARSLNTVDQENCVVVQVMNVSPGNVTLCKGTPLGEFIPIHDVFVVDTCHDQDTQAEHIMPPTVDSTVDVDLSSSNLSIQEEQRLYNVLHSFRDVFATTGEPLGRTSVVKHKVKTTGSPICQPLRRLPVALKDTFKEEVTKMLNQGVIRHSNSPWSSPLVMVWKKDNTWRFCVDYHKLNSVTHHDIYPLPRIDTTLDSLSDCSLFTTLDLASGYWQVEVAESDKEKTAFSTPQGHFEFNVMPFGLTNAPATFQWLMECVLAGLSGEECLIYLNDIIIFSSSFDDHLVHLTSVLQCLQEAGLKLKPTECHFAMQQVTYFGHVISADSVGPDSSKIAVVADYPTPKDAKQLRQFLGLTNYYRRLVKHYATIAESLHEALRGKQKHFTWDQCCNEAFETLKKHLVSPPILALPNFSEPFILYTDASDVAVGGVLGQVQDGAERVIAYWSRQLKPAERKYSTIEREILAAVSAIKDFYPYLYRHPFTLMTDHNPLTSLKNLKDFGGRLTRWSLFLQQFDFQFQYKRGASHTNADSLSHCPPVPVSPISESSLLGDPATIRKAQDDDPQLHHVISTLVQGKSPTDCAAGLRRCFLSDGVLCRHYTPSASHVPHIQIVVPASLRSEVLHNHAGHLGVKRTTGSVKTRFYWPGYDTDISQWVLSCQECQQRNSPAIKPRAPLGTLQASYPFEHLSWDIMGPLPTSEKGNRFILVVTDIFTKWVEAFPLQNTLSTTLANILVICRYGVPSYLHSDQGANLCIEVVQSICDLLGIKKTHMSAYHPQGNGQVERFNRTIQAILTKMIQETGIVIS